MNTKDSNLPQRRVVGAVLLSALLAACSKPKTPGEETPVPATPPPQAAAAPAPAPVKEIPVVVISNAPTQAPAPATAPPAKAATTGSEPAVAAMQLAQPSGKLGVPVDLRYQFDGEARDGQTATLHLAAVPRVAGSNLNVTIKDVPGIRTSAGELRAEKVSMATPYRRQLAVTRDAGGPAELRVLVTMDLPEGSAFSWFSVPLGNAPAAGKQAPVRME
jgi:hypothetical protein